MPLSVLLLSRYARRGASSRARFYIYREALERSGIALTSAPFFDDDYLVALYGGKPVWGSALRAYGRRLVRLLSARRYDLLWVEKELAPWVPAWLERMALGRMRYVVDFDDAWFLRYRLNRSAAVRAVLGDKLERVTRGAALTVAGNDYLAEWARDAGAAEILLLPTVVELARYPLRPPPGGRFTIGWIGSPATAHYLAGISEPLRRICSDGTTRLLVIGADHIALDGVRMEHVPWDETTEAESLSRCHIGIMPLVDDPWSRGKCGYKLIQYMAAGRPAVASPVGANLAIIKDGANGFLAETPQQWLDALLRLRDDPALRVALGSDGRRLIESTYCTDRTSGPLARALYAAAGKAPDGRLS